MCPKGIVWHTNLWLSVFKYYMKWGIFRYHLLQYTKSIAMLFSYLVYSIYEWKQTGQEAVVLHRRLRESHRFQEMQVLQEMYPKVMCGHDAWKRDLITESEAILSAFPYVIGNSWIFQLLSSADSVLALVSSNVFTLSSDIACLGFCKGILIFAAM